jgi:hypothetical protein
MPIEKVNVYVGYSCPIMGTNNFGVHTINLLHGATSIIWFVNFSSLIPILDQFLISPLHVEQVFFSIDPKERAWKVVL